MKIVTGNRLETGDVVWWAGDGWSTSISDAVGLEKDAADAVVAREAAGERINDLAAIDAEESDGVLRPLHIRERIRGFGPTVRPDLAVGKSYA